MALQDGDTAKALDLYRQALESYTDALEISPGNVRPSPTAAGSTTTWPWAWATDPRATSSTATPATSSMPALAADPTFADARVFRAFLHADAGEFAQAQADCSTGSQPGDVPPYMTDELASPARPR